jgi:Fe-S-cluster containining protein
MHTASLEERRPRVAGRPNTRFYRFSNRLWRLENVGTPFYKRTQGLRFDCTRCGDCCTRPGPVYFSSRELIRASEFLGLTPRVFRRRYRVRLREGTPAVDPGRNAPCPFYDQDTGCRIYEARPVQCRTWPFWPEVVLRERSWRRASGDCEGMNRGRRHSVGEIEREVRLCQEEELPRGDPW